jgi:hypothetical protein
MDQQQIENTDGWQLLSSMLHLSADDAATLASHFSVGVGQSGGKAQIAYSGELFGCPLDGVFGITIGLDGNGSLFVQATLKVNILGSTYPVIVWAVFTAKGAVFSGTIKQTLPEVPVIKLRITDPLLIVGVSAAGIPTFGVGGQMDLGSSLETSCMMLFDSKDPQKSVFIAAVSELSVKTIVESIAHISLPSGIDTLLDVVKLTHFKDEEFTIAASLAGDLDAEKLDGVSAAFNANKVALPATVDQVVLVVRDKGKSWSITNLKDDLHRHYQLKKADDSTIKVIVDPQVYCVPKATSVAGYTFAQGFFMSGRVDILGLGGEATVQMHSVAMGGVPGVSLDADLDRIVIADERLFSIVSATDSSKGPHLSYETISSPGAQLQWPSLGDPHFDLDAKVTLVGLSQSATVRIGLQGCSFSLSAGPANVSGSLDRSLTVSANVTIDIGSVSIPLLPSVDVGRISAGLTISPNGARFDDFNFSVLGVGFTVPGFGVSAGDSLTDLAGTVKDQAIDKVRDYFADYFNPAKYLAQAASYLKDFGSEAIKDVVNGITTGGGMWGTSSSSSAPPPDPQNDTKQQTANQIAQYNQKSSDLAKSPLTAGVFPARTADDWVQLYAGLKFLPAQLVGPLRQNGYAAGDIAAAIKTVYQMPAAGVALALRDAGFPAGEVASALAWSCSVVTSGAPGEYGLLAQLLFSCGYDFNSAADCLRYFVNASLPPNISGITHDVTVSSLLAAGYTATTDLPSTLDVPVTLYFIAGVAGVPSARMLCATADNLVAFSGTDGTFNGQYWLFGTVADGSYIVAPMSGGLLSCTPDGGPLLDISGDDQSGRQHWKLAPTGDGSFTVECLGIPLPPPPALPRKYLSSGPAGNDLFSVDDGSGRQQWRLLPYPPADGTKYTIQVSVNAPQLGGHYLGYPDDDGRAVALSGAVDGLQRQRWTFEMVAKGVYRIKPAGRLSYLSCKADGSVVDLFDSDDGSGRQHWKLTPADSFGLTFTMEAAAGVGDRKYLSCNSDGTVIDLYTQDDQSGRQRWTVSLSQS